MAGKAKPAREGETSCPGAYPLPVCFPSLGDVRGRASCAKIRLSFVSSTSAARVYCQERCAATSLQELDKGPACTMAGRSTVEAAGADTPGPGEYCPACPAAGAAFTMAGARQPTSQAEIDTPGPGAYHAAEDHKRRPAFTLGAKLPNKHLSGTGDVDTPGPGEYRVPSPDEGAAYTMSGARKPAPATDDTPGPGTYQASEDPKRGPAFTLAAKLPGK